MDCYTVIKLKCLELDQSQVAGLMKSWCLAALLLVVFPAADLFEEVHVDSSLVTAIPVPAPLWIAGNAH